MATAHRPELSTTSGSWYHCYQVNSHGHTWTHVRIDGTTAKGWVYDAYLSNGGSTVPC
ncbi:MAG: hypothetical protein QOE23_838 [Pseudonocardiales bacterium]|nr:hypothetical protein [Pseudonocardiales bacterium]